MDVTPYLKLMVEKNASDLFITTNCEVKIKLEGVITSVGKTILTGDICKAAAYNIMNDMGEDTDAAYIIPSGCSLS